MGVHRHDVEVAGGAVDVRRGEFQRRDLVLFVGGSLASDPVPGARSGVDDFHCKQELQPMEQDKNQTMDLLNKFTISR